MLDWPAFDQHFFGLAQDYRAKFLLGKLVRKRNPSRGKAQVDGNGLEGKPITDADDPASITARPMGVKNSLTTAFQRGMGRHEDDEGQGHSSKAWQRGYLQDRPVRLIRKSNA